ncbi:hypothetical protein ACFSTI_01525 [Rhizorhabdus histidinilytica]
MIKSGGENVSSREVEEAIYAHPHVSEVAVIGLPDPHWIEAVTAFIVPRNGADVSAEDIHAHCAGRLAGFKRPKRSASSPNCRATPPARSSNGSCAIRRRAPDFCIRHCRTITSDRQGVSPPRPGNRSSAAPHSDARCPS